MHKILFQLDTDPIANTFDTVVGYDGGADRVHAIGSVTPENVDALVEKADLVFDCAPLFSERFAMNRACVEQGKPMVEAAMFDMEGQVTTIIPGETPCLACLYPEDPPRWKREFPVLGAVSSIAASIAAVEGIKVIAGFGETLAGTLLYYDSRNMTFQRIPAVRRPGCPVCGWRHDARRRTSGIQNA